jgi:hypothetical protein
MLDRYDPRSPSDRDRDDFSDRSRGSRGGTSERDHADDRDPREVFTKDLDLPRGRERRPVRERDRVYEITGTESRMLATVGAFRVVAESDLHDGRDDNTRKAQRHLEREGLLHRRHSARTTALSSSPTLAETCSKRIGTSDRSAPGSPAKPLTLASDSRAS